MWLFLDPNRKLPLPSSTTITSSSSYYDEESYEIATTNFGWNTPSGNSFSRRIVSGEFFNATLAHPRYNASAWADLDAHPDPKRKIIAFMDVDTSIETNYPIYAPPNWKKNVEKTHPVHGRSAMLSAELCTYIKRAVESPALKANLDSRLVLVDAADAAKFQLRSVCRNVPNIFDNPQVIIAYYSARRESVRPMHDVGIPPPAIKTYNLTTSDRDAIQSCEKRKFLFSFVGRAVTSEGRLQLLKFENETDFNIRLFQGWDILGDTTNYLKYCQTRYSLARPAVNNYSPTVFRK